MCSDIIIDYEKNHVEPHILQKYSRASNLQTLRTFTQTIYTNDDLQQGWFTQIYISSSKVDICCVVKPFSKNKKTFSYSINGSCAIPTNRR